jgi:hypothetical protein
VGTERQLYIADYGLGSLWNVCSTLARSLCLQRLCRVYWECPGSIGRVYLADRGMSALHVGCTELSASRMLHMLRLCGRMHEACVCVWIGYVSRRLHDRLYTDSLFSNYITEMCGFSVCYST